MTAFANIGQKEDKGRQNQHLKRSTVVKNVLQIGLFLCKTKPILRQAQDRFLEKL